MGFRLKGQMQEISLSVSFITEFTTYRVVVVRVDVDYAYVDMQI